MRIGIIGVGVIGGALFNVIKAKGLPVSGFDKFKAEYQRPECWDAVLGSDVAFICVPTRTVDKMQDLSEVMNVFSSLNEACFTGIAVLRSTVLPGTTDRLIAKYPNLRILHNPEFLTAANPERDLLKQPCVLIGGTDCDAFNISEAALVLRSCWRLIGKASLPVIARKPIETEMAKYIHNCFLATKVSFLNDMFEICEKLGASYDEAIDLAHTIGQVGEGHSKVPGPDGLVGYGGFCFPKDMNALSGWCEQHGVPAEVLNAAIRGNNRRRINET